MKKLLLLLSFLFIINNTTFAQSPALTRAQYVHLQTVKSDTLNQMAMKLAIPGASNKQLDQAIEYIMKGRFAYSRFRDTVGMRLTFTNLAYVYRLQKKDVQAKWFYIEANTASRDLKDTLGIIESLVKLAEVKTEIKDYPMADRDLMEAVQLAKTRLGIDEQIAVQNALANFYTKKGDVKQAAAALRRITFLKDSVLKIADNQKLALLKKEQAQQQSIIKQQEHSLKTEEAQAQNLLKQKNGITLITIAVIVLITLLIFWRYINGKRKKRKLGK